MSLLALLLLCAPVRASDGGRDIDHEKLRTGIETRTPDELVPYYGFGIYSRPLMVSVGSDMLARPLKGWLKNHRIPRLTLQTSPEERAVAWPRKGADIDLDELPPAAIVAIIDVFKREQPGVEVDMLVRDAPGTRIPVTVWWDTNRAVRVAVGARYDLHAHDPPSRGEIAARFGVELVEDPDGRRWGSADRARVLAALSTLTETELACIRDVPFELAPGRHPTRGNVLAVYSYDWNGPARFIFYKTSSDQNLTAFFGSAFSPQDHATQTFLHEVAHAIGGARSRRVAAVRYADPERALDQDEWRQRGLPSAAEAAWADTMGAGWRPTQYGQGNVKEGFADFFSLTRIDRAAMERVAPDVVEWFDAGHHVDCPDPATLAP